MGECVLLFDFSEVLACSIRQAVLGSSIQEIMEVEQKSSTIPRSPASQFLGSVRCWVNRTHDSRMMQNVSGQ